MSQIFDRASLIRWTIGFVLMGGVFTVGSILGWSSQTLGGAFILALIASMVISDPLERRYRRRHPAEPPRQT